MIVLDHFTIRQGQNLLQSVRFESIEEADEVLANPPDVKIGENNYKHSESIVSVCVCGQCNRDSMVWNLMYDRE